MRSRQSYELAQLGVRVHSENAWRVAIAPNTEQRYYPRFPVQYHTTQNRIWIDAAEDKQRQILNGWPLCVTVTSAATEFGANALWICNGHHTLAAYLDLGRRPCLRHFDRASLASGCPVKIPRFNALAR